MSDTPVTTGTPAPVAAAPAPAAPAGVIAVQVNGKHVRVVTGTLKHKDKKGFPTFRFVPSGDVAKRPALSDILSLISALDVESEFAALVNRELLPDYASEIADAIRATNADGTMALNWAAAAAKAKEIITREIAEKESSKSILEHLADLNGELRKLHSEVMAGVAAGKNLNTDPGMKELSNKVSQLSLKIGELEAKRTAIKRKAAAATAPVAAAPVAAPAK